MSDYSVADAETHLPRPIDRAMEGEAVVITRHGKPVAELHRADSHPAASDISIHDWLRARRLGRPASASSSIERMRKLHEEAGGILS
jgi:antitoxin (DNA-binding transcriptional repressor) of toxin-antitoxin stability system